MSNEITPQTKQSLLDILKKKLTLHKVQQATEEPEERLHGLEVIKAFSTGDEPKLVDYPRGKYCGQWETVLGEVPGGYTAVVRFYGYAGYEDRNKEFILTSPTIRALRPAVHTLIRDTMQTFKR